MTRYTIVRDCPTGISIPVTERNHALFTQPVDIEISVDPTGIDCIVNHVNPVGISKVTGIPLSATVPVLLRVIVYSNISSIRPTHQFRSTTSIVSSRRARFNVKEVALLASI